MMHVWYTNNGWKYAYHFTDCMGPFVPLHPSESFWMVPGTGEMTDAQIATYHGAHPQ